MKKLLWVSLILLGIGMLWGETQLDVRLLNTWEIPYPYDYSQQRDNGDIQFYKVACTEQTISCQGFTYDHEAGTFTEEMQIFSEANVMGASADGDSVAVHYKFDRFYLIYECTDGVLAYILQGNTLEHSCHLPGVYLKYESGLDVEISVVLSSAIVVATNNAFERYDLATGLSTLQQEYTNPDYAPVVFDLPDSTFFLVEEDLLASTEDIWHLYNDEGGSLHAPWVISEFSGSWIHFLSEDVGTIMINEYFYFEIIGASFTTALCEGYIENGDLSLSARSYQDENEHCGMLCPYGTDSVIEMVLPNEGVFVYNCYQQPIGNGENVILLPTFYNTMEMILNKIDTNLDVCSYLEDGNIRLATIWSNEFPSMSYFSFPAEVALNESFISYSQNPLLYVVTSDHIYECLVQEVEGADDHLTAPTHPQLQLYPNPLTAGTALSIKPSLDRPGRVDIYNIKGQKVRSLATTGSNAITWDRKDTVGQDVASGIYMVRYQAGDVTQNRKCVIVK